MEESYEYKYLKYKLKYLKTKYELEGDTVQTESFYEVSEGDSLWSIAEQFYCDGRKWIHIHYANQEAFPSLKENPSIIRSRWKLKIPTL